MEKKVLLTYASKYGSTKEIADKIRDLLEGRKIANEMLSVEKVNNLNDYSAVIIGSAVYMGQWRKKAVNLLKNNIAELRHKKVWIFSTGPTGKGDPVELLEGWKIPKNLEDTVAQINPVDIKVFGGKLEEGRLSFMDKFIIKKVKAPVGDFIDWKDVEKWTVQIISQLK